VKKNKITSPILSFNYHLENYNELVKGFRRKKDASKIEKYFKNCFSSELESKIHNYDYDALVLSDKDHRILWVNDGFRDMTGFTKKFAVGKKPSFLQGEKTSLAVKTRLKNELALNHTFSGSIVNYRRNGELYLCHITILPVYNLDEKLKYYLALEKDETNRAHFNY
tara:strand:- start:367 stop:867 length:501 start_codon:yes stop_codon:yes gene_type:complete